MINITAKPNHRPLGTGKYGEPTKVMRVPVSKVGQVNQFLAVQPTRNYIYLSINVSQLSIPLLNDKVPAGSPTGFPSPAEDEAQERLNPNDYLVHNELATVFVQVEGESMVDIGIFPGDIVTIDKSIQAMPGHVVVAWVENSKVIPDGRTIKVLETNKIGELLLSPRNNANPKYKPIPFKEGMTVIIEGVVVSSFRRFKF